MDRTVRLIILPTIVISVLCGYLRTLDGLKGVISFPTLHIFLFNLTCGGSLLLTHLSGRERFGAREFTFYILAVIFSISVATGIYPVAIACALIMSVLVETVRWQMFNLFSLDFFKNVPASRKFEQAALLCLSMGLAICAATILNNEYLKIISFAKLDVHVFFLGFSFPVSLITFGYIFSRIEKSARPPSRIASEFSFWALNLGVIFFFIFIVFEIYPVQFVMASFLFSVVVVAIILHLTRKDDSQEWRFITSALSFLSVGSLLGVIYVIILWKSENYNPGYMLNFHSAANVFGWNMTWILLVLRKGDFPLRIRPAILIALLWGMVAMIPLGRDSAIFGVPGIILAVLFLGFALFSGGSESSPDEADA